jgi:hypothetical protein
MGTTRPSQRIQQSSRTSLSAVWPPTASVAAVAGHVKKSPMMAIREKCADCCGGQLSEIRRCESLNCALWPFRSGRHPYTAARMKNSALDSVFREEGNG